MTQRKKPSTDSNDPENMERAANMQADIERTRGEISEDLRALGDQLSPERLKSDAKEAVQEAKEAAKETLQEAKHVATDTFREVKESALETVHEKVDDLRASVRSAERQTRDFFSENAVPLALMGIGAAWFMAKRRQRANVYYSGRDYRFEPERWRSSSAGERARPLRERAGERVRSMSESAEDRYDDVKERVRGFAEREGEQARRVAREAGQRVSESGERARDFMGRELQSARDFSRRVSDEQPLAVGLAAIAAGIGVGLLLPQTEPERELLGNKRDELISEAKQTLSDMSQSARDTARDMKDTISNSVQR